jgi:hypothetical protein
MKLFTGILISAALLVSMPCFAQELSQVRPERLAGAPPPPAPAPPPPPSTKPPVTKEPTATSAAQASEPPAPINPCARGPSRIKLGGVDLDALKCLNIVLAQQRDAQVQQVSNKEAIVSVELLLARDDLEKASAQLKDVSAREGWWQHCITDPACVTWANQGH